MKKSNTERKIKIHVPLNRNKLLEKAVERINSNEEIYAIWNVININALERLSMSDHGPVHFQIVANIALRLARILSEKGVELDIAKDHDLTNGHSELVIFLASIMHDMGMSISREGHEEYSLFLVNNLLRELIDFLSVKERVIVTSETLHAIIAHRKGGIPYTIEAGIVRVADALDMSEGRTRVPYEAGKIDIYNISATAINNIEIKKGKEKPIQINIEMNNSSGIFQIDELLKNKIKGSGVEKYMEVKAFIKGAREKNLLKEFVIKDY